MARGKRLWGFDEVERRLLLEATTEIPELRAVLLRAAPRADLGAELAGVWFVGATVHELDEMYSLVEALMDGTRRRRRLEVLEGLRATLCNSIDGF